VKYLLYLGVVAAVIDAITRAKPGESVSVPPIRGVRVSGRSYTLNVVATPE
jgi:hypothetical protein